MEIYKDPGIYNSPNIYESGQGGGGGVSPFDHGSTTIQGVEYPTISINGDTWLAKNFNYLIPDIPINPGTTNTPGQFYPRDEYREIYGMLYNAAAIEYIEQNKDSICHGWRVPTKDDFDKLINFLNGVSGLCKVLCSSNYNYGLGDIVGFNLLPGGNWDKGYGAFYYEGSYAYLYSLTKNNENKYFHMSTTNTNVMSFDSMYGDPEYALNLRLIKE